MRMLVGLLLGVLALSRLAAVEFSEGQIGEVRVTVCRVERNEKLELFWKDEAGAPLRRLSRAAKLVAARGQKLVFAMNAGMYEEDRSPLGLFIAGGQPLRPLNTRGAAWGNFYLKPNGVFCVTAAGARVVETSEFPSLRDARLATQSGPMLVHRGQLHPKFQADSVSKLFRNGVGAGPRGQAIFAITEGPVNFHQFATFFRDELKCPEALFLDGTVSSLYAPALGRDDFHIDLGPMIGVVE